MTALRFVLDQDVDAQNVGVLVAMGYDAWTVGDAGNARATDSEQLIYAQEHDATLITHDKEFASSRKRMPIGRLVQLRCAEWDAGELLELLIPDIAHLLERKQDIIVVASLTSLRTHSYQVFHGTERPKK